MYIKRIQNWDDTTWERYFEQYWIVAIWKKEYLREILSRETKEDIELDFNFLGYVWIINWIWPWFFPNWLRKLLAKLFPFVRFEWHDIEYWIFWDEEDRQNADFGVWKYSMKWNEWNCFKTIVACLAYKIVRRFWKSSFSYIK